jgi:hypothetical protein
MDDERMFFLPNCLTLLIVPGQVILLCPVAIDMTSMLLA